MQRVWACSSVG